MATLSSDPTTIEGVEDELAFTDILVESLDPESDTYVVQAAELERKKAHLNRLLALMRQSARPGGNMRQQHATHSSSVQGDDAWWQPRMDGRPSTPHSSSDSSSGLPSGIPYVMPSQSAKRPRPQSAYLSPFAQHPSKRQTPDPSNAGTPVSSEDSDYTEDQARLHARARRRQQEAEALARREYEAQQADLAYARQLSQRSHPPASFASSSRPSVQTTMNYNGTYQKPPSHVRPQQSSSRHQSYTQHPGHATTYRQPIKPEPSFNHQQQLTQRPRHDLPIVDLTADDSDEDIKEIAPTSFASRPNQPANVSYGGFAPVPRPTPVLTTMQQQTTMQMPGAYPSHIPMGQNYGLYNNGLGYDNYDRNSGDAWWNDATSGMDNSFAAPLQPLREYVASVSSQHDLEKDSSDDDVVYGGYRHLGGPLYSNYAGNEALYRERYDAIAAHDLTKTREEIQALLENIRPDEELPAHLRVQTPEALSVKLHKYQELGLTWLKNCEEGSNKGGILADDMGLGKTIQMLSLMVTRKSDDPRCKTTLIIAPVALMRQWAQEIRSKLKGGRHALSIFTHHGSHKAKSFQDLRSYDVVLTTYGSIAAELKKRERFELRKRINPEVRPNPADKCIFLDDDSHWYRIVLDEAQCIKNRNTQTAKAACRLSATYRFCVTGTPMMNNVEEFYSLIHFLRIRPFCRWDRFRLDINTPLKSGSEEVRARGMQVLQTLCRAVMLRRTKSSYFEGEPILVLPERTTEVDNPVFDEDEQAFYNALETQSRLDFNKYLRRGTVGQSYSAILVLLLRLRQACCHPHLIRDFGVAAAADLKEDQMLEFAKQLEETVVARIKETKGNFECPVCYDVTPNPAIFIPCGHDTCAECFSRIADPANAIHNGEEGGGVRCPNCRGAIDPKRLTDFQSFKKVHMPELLTPEERGDMEAGEIEVEDEDTSTADSDSETESGDEEEEEEDEVEDETLGGFIVNDDESEPNKETEDGVDGPSYVDELKKEHAKEEGVAGSSSNDNDGIGMFERKGKGRVKQKLKKRQGKKGKGKAKMKKAKTAVTLSELKKLATRNKQAKKAYLQRLRKDWVSSAKIEKTMEILEGIMDFQEGEKVLIFSQWTSLLDLLELPIDEAGYGYRRYDGSMSAAMRGDAVDDFRDEAKNVRIMLISLKAGNAGLNLNMANQVIILDPFWNPYIEEQAIDRAHRFGQMRPVKVHRLLIPETVEDRIISLQEKKRALIQEALDENRASALSRLGVQELAYLFGVTHDSSARVDYVERGRR